MRKKKKKPVVIREDKFESLKRPEEPRPNTSAEVPDTSRIKQNYGLSSRRADSLSAFPEFPGRPSTSCGVNKSSSPDRKMTL